MNQAEIFIGTSGWHYDDWRDVFYPPKLARARWLEYYSDHFNTVEINATFYRTFADNVFEKRAARVPSGFRFVFKAPRVITHRKYLSTVEKEIREFDRKVALTGTGSDSFFSSLHRVLRLIYLSWRKRFRPSKTRRGSLLSSVTEGGSRMILSHCSARGE
ncbi:MAG: hypothetical protein A2176_10315 [Spirochaetes bacterium RBG_13_51_14]|nr:MAG: hypothetical protein A2176_10315 [Spirochaetes bacterium RBG_13_51_14]